MSAMPWDRFTPTDPGIPETPYVPTQDTPVPVPSPSPPVPAPIPADISTAITDSFNDWAAQVLPALRDQAIDYARDSIRSIMEGRTVDLTHPTITATTATGRELIVADAKSRSARTFLQGLTFDLFAALVAGVATLAGADPFQKQTWIAFGVLLLKTFVSAGLSYVMRLKVTPTIKTEGEKLAIMPVPRPIVKE